MKAQWIALYLVVAVMCADVDDETATNNDVFGFCDVNALFAMRQQWTTIRSDERAMWCERV
jgi:hypothetical protein